jgi:hypothetical protein
MLETIAKRKRVGWSAAKGVIPREIFISTLRRNVECRARGFANKRFGDARGPFDETGHAQAAFPQGAFRAAQVAGGLRPSVAAVVAAIPEEEIVGGNHSSKPIPPGDSGSLVRMARPGIEVVFRSPFVPLRRNLPKWPVAYPADCRARATVSSCARIGEPGLNVPQRFGCRLLSGALQRAQVHGCGRSVAGAARSGSPCP